MMKIFSTFILTLLIFTSISFAQIWERRDISFEFDSYSMPLVENVVVDQVIKILPFNVPGRVDLVNAPKFRLIMGYGSLSIFNALKVDEVAGLKREDAEKFLNDLQRRGKTEIDGAFIAGLTNISNSGEFFVFYNLERMKHSRGYANRILAHEPLHMARLLITTIENPTIDYVNDPWTNLTDANEEYFAEMLERVAAISSYFYLNAPLE